MTQSRMYEINGHKLAVLPINPGADLALIRGAGHLPFLERPIEYQAALSGWLNKT